MRLTPEEAIADFYQHIVEEHKAGGDAWLEVSHVACCLAFGRGPNAETIAAMNETEEGGGMRFRSVAEVRAYFESASADDDDDDDVNE